MKTKFTVEETSETQGTAYVIVEHLTLSQDLYPLEIIGEHLDVFNAGYTITMSNGDKIDWYYRGNPFEDKIDQAVIVNGSIVMSSNEMDIPQEDIKRAYIMYLGRIA